MKKTIPLPVTTVLALCALGLVGFVLYPQLKSEAGADPFDSEQVEMGRKVYAAVCASCHGVNLEGQPNWRTRLASGAFPAPPHDESGHTWHHPDKLLFKITKLGPKAYGDPSIVSDMPAFGGQLSDKEIWAVLAYIKRQWPAEIRDRQADINRRAAG